MKRFEWEMISWLYNDEKCQKTMRAKVPGGWLVNNFHAHLRDHGFHIISESMVFVPDPPHRWEIVSSAKQE